MELKMEGKLVLGYGLEGFQADFSRLRERVIACSSRPSNEP